MYMACTSFASHSRGSLGSSAMAVRL